MAFLEVKLASDGSATMPWEKIDPVKQSRIAAAASIWLAASRFPGYCRFDVAVVRGVPGAFTVEYLEDAFRAGGGYSV